MFLLAFFLDFFELSFIVVPLLGPVAEKLGIDIIWFGVLLAVNMQTSFMHPPFGFALFYLRSVAPVKEYVDKLTGKITAPITTMQIYWGAVPYVIIQVIMIGIVIAFPQMVMVYKGEASTVDPTKIQIDLPTIDQGTPPALEIPGADKGGARREGRSGQERRPAAGHAAAAGRRRRDGEQVARGRAQGEVNETAPRAAGLVKEARAGRAHFAAGGAISSPPRPGPPSPCSCRRCSRSRGTRGSAPSGTPCSGRRSS